MKKIILLLLGTLVFDYGQCQQSENTTIANPEVKTVTANEISSKTAATTFEPEMTATVVEPKSEMITTAKATKASFKERIVAKYLGRQIKKSQSNKSINPKAEKTNTIALISGIAAIVSLATLFIGSSGIIAIIGLLAAIAAIIMGFVGKSQIQDGNGSGKGWAITGIVGGILYFFVILLAVVFVASLLGSNFGA